MGYINVEDESDVWTCVRDVDPSSPWWVISKDKLNGDFASNPTDEWQNNLQVPGRIFRAMGGDTPANQPPAFTRNFAMEFDAAQVARLLILGSLWRCAWSHYGESRHHRQSQSTAFYHDIDQPTGDITDPIMPISMQDGEGGPGGKAASDSGDAYGVLRCGDLGSIAGQVFVGADTTRLKSKVQRLSALRFFRGGYEWKQQHS